MENNMVLILRGVIISPIFYFSTSECFESEASETSTLPI
jgi:hypothetical protein